MPLDAVLRFLTRSVLESQQIYPDVTCSICAGSRDQTSNFYRFEDIKARPADFVKRATAAVLQHRCLRLQASLPPYLQFQCALAPYWQRACRMVACNRNCQRKWTCLGLRGNERLS